MQHFMLIFLAAGIESSVTTGLKVGTLLLFICASLVQFTVRHTPGPILHPFLPDLLCCVIDVDPQVGIPLYKSAYGAFVARTANVDTLIVLVLRSRLRTHIWMAVHLRICSLDLPRARRWRTCIRSWSALLLWPARAVEVTSHHHLNSGRA